MGTRDQGMLRWKKRYLVRPPGFLRSAHYRKSTASSRMREVILDGLNRGVVRVSRRNLSDVADGGVPTLSCQLLDLGDGLEVLSVQPRDNRCVPATASVSFGLRHRREWL